ncbi:MAG TPA: OmpH family outer membrane protein [Fimbriimonadaceae bacterium]|nr:OmpH family outer membrane protein [Fimbriimonadaceae bacterium]
MRASQLGWVLSAAIVGVTLGGGFQAKTNKSGWIDMQAIYGESALKAKNDGRLQTATQVRRDAIDFLRLNPGFTDEQLIRYKALSIKESRTPADITELTKLKADAQAATNRFDELRKKPNASSQELKDLDALAAINESNKRAATVWAQECTQQMDTMQADLNASSIESMRTAIAQVAKAQGFSLVFRENVAPYGSNNLGPDVKKIVDKNAK